MSNPFDFLNSSQFTSLHVTFVFSSQSLAGVHIFPSNYLLLVFLSIVVNVVLLVERCGQTERELSISARKTNNNKKVG